jgi:hypothetical protein
MFEFVKVTRVVEPLIADVGMQSVACVDSI